MRKKVIAGNWKMNMSPSDVVLFMDVFKELVKDTKNEVILCVPFVDLTTLLDCVKGTNIKVGAQNVYFEENGAFTGEISAKMLEDMGVEYVIIGHSERREYFSENDEIINKKMKIAFAHNLKPILCVGETLEQREEGITERWLKSQVENALIGIDSVLLEDLIIAYEPIWAIGTGRTASNDDANQAIGWIREKISELYGKDIANRIIIQYGGSVKSSNSKELFAMPEIDGGLVGGSSLKPDEFSKVVNCI